MGMVPHPPPPHHEGSSLIAIVNTAHVVFPAASVTINSYMPLADTVVQLMKETPLSVAVTPGEVSEKVMVTGVA